MTTVAFVLGVLFMAAGVAVSIALHEVGHLVPAKRFGVRVTQYMVGFGPTVWSRRRGETEYGVKAIPLGGYIRMIGMFPPRAGDPEGTLRASSTGRFSQLMDEARAASLEEVRPGDEDRVFYRLSVPKKVLVMMGGPLMNLLIGIVLLTVLVTVHGVLTPQKGAEVASVAQCVVPATQVETTSTCAGPAAHARPRRRHPPRRPVRLHRRAAGAGQPRRRPARAARGGPGRSRSSSSATAGRSPSPPPRSATSSPSSTRRAHRSPGPTAAWRPPRRASSASPAASRRPT